MKKFLEQTADYLVGQYGDRISSVCIVLPNRRGGLYLRKYIARLEGKTIWSPVFYSIEDFIVELSGMKAAENTRLLFELYDVHREIEGPGVRPFEEFISWGQQLIHDFSEADAYLVDPASLFSYLSEARALTVWNLDRAPLTPFQADYLRFYRSLQAYYDRFTERLKGAGSGYPGMLFREVAGAIENIADSLPWEKVVFAGFNALTRAEEKIIDVLFKSGKADLLWDIDQYYFADKKQEAGDFLRLWSKKWPASGNRWIQDAFASGEKSITVTGVPLNIGQVKFCGEVLTDMLGKKIRPEDIAVVLVDEQLLMPLLNSLPQAITSLNITMGLSLKQSTLYTLFDAVFRMHENVEKFRKNTKTGQPVYYFKDVLRILQHPEMAGMADFQTSGNRFLYDELVEQIRSGNRIFPDMGALLTEPTGLFLQNLGFLSVIFEPWKDLPDAFSCLKQLISYLRDAILQPGIRSGSGNVRMEYLYAFSRVLQQVSDLVGQYRSVTGIPALHQLFNRIAENTSLPFYGEPLQGLQVMGMLETRTLDFEHLILLSVNEDLIPSGRTLHSFIPFDIRKDFGLPTYTHKNSVYAYHFYRLLQRSKSVHLIYNTEPDDLGGGEKSRFIRQVMEELPAYNPRVTIFEQVLSTSPVTGIPYPPIVIEKKDEVRDLLRSSAGRGLSPTYLNQYRHCSLKFYFSFIVGLKEPEELEETIDPRIFGQAVHDTLFELYSPFRGNTLAGNDLDSMLAKLDDAIFRSFGKKYRTTDLSFGPNHLRVNVAKIMVRNFLRQEKKRIERQAAGGPVQVVRYLEERLSVDIPVHANGEMIGVKVKGVVDRVDAAGNRWFVIDYKTGKVDKNSLKVDDWSLLRDDPALDMAFQLLTYSFLLANRYAKQETLLFPAILSLKSAREGNIFLSLPGETGNNGITKESLKEFGQLLNGILEEIFDYSKSFRQTEDTERCTRCPFVTLCER